MRRLLESIILLLIFIYSTPQLLAIDVSENFNNGMGGFNTSKWFSLSNQRLVFNGDGTNTTKLTVWNGSSNPGGWNAKPQHSNYFTDFNASVDATWLSGDNSGYGISVCNTQNRFGDPDYLRFLINGVGNGYFLINAKIDGDYKELQDWTKTSLIKENQLNKLKIIKSGNEFRFYINFTEVKRLVIEGCVGGTIGVEASNRLNAAFDNFEIKDLSNQSPTATFTISPNQGNAPLTVQLDASTSTDDGNIVQYQWTSSDGQTADGVQTSLTFSQVGTYNITLTVTDNEGATASSTQTLTVNEKPLPPPVEGVGQAIIIAAGGAQQSNTLFRYSNEFTQRFYRLLKQRGFEDEDVYYMNPHAPNIDNLEGYLEEDKHDYKLFDPASELTTAFQQAASKLQAGQQFIFFLHGHASQNNFRIKPDYELSANHLGELLAMLPAGVQQIIILDSCYSGSFFDELAGVEGRILISSADSSNLAWNAEYASFTDTFLRSLGRSFNLTEAFQQAENLIISDKQLFGEQRPWLDDNGDGQYTTDDGRRAAKIYLGKQAVHAAPPPTIHQVHPRQELPKDVNNATLWLRTTPDVDGIRKVRAIIVNPQFVGQDYQGLETNFGRDELELIYNHAQKRYEIVYDGFRTEGMWRILYQAQSKEGIWSDIVQGEVQSQGSPKIATIKMQLNQSRYKITEPLHLNLQIDGQTEADLYVAIIFPDKDFITFGYPSNPSWPNEAKIYQPKVKIAGQQNYPVNINLPSNAELGQYSTCGVLVKADAAPLEMGNWIDFHCAEFEVY